MMPDQNNDNLEANLKKKEEAVSANDESSAQNSRQQPDNEKANLYEKKIMNIHLENLRAWFSNHL